MAIYAITGKPRHGKTLFLAKKVVEMLRNNERVFSNIKINVGLGALKSFTNGIVGDWSKEEDRNNQKKLLFYWTNIHDWEHMEKGNIICDEMQRYFNARQWASLSPETEIKLQQHGKEDLNIWGTVQHYTRLDITMRILVEEYFIIKTVFGSPDNQKRFFGLKRIRVASMDLETIDDYYNSLKFPDSRVDLDVKVRHFWFRKKYALIYDTREKVGASEEMPLVHKERQCLICKKVEVRHV